MSVLIDTPIWSLAFRRKTANSPEVAVLERLVRQGLARIIGPVRQEVLSAIRAPERFTLIRDSLRAFPDLPLTTEHHELAAEFHNTCRAKGIQGSHIDFLICATASLHGLTIYTTDADFGHFSKHLPVRVYGT